MVILKKIIKYRKNKSKEIIVLVLKILTQETELVNENEEIIIVGNAI